MLRRAFEKTLAAAVQALTGVWPARSEERAAVLMYHNVCTLPVAAAGVFQHVLPHQFAEQMCLLRRLDCRVVSLRRLAEMLWSGRPLPPRCVAITFDDGYRGLLGAWEHLERHGYPATVFLATAFIGRPAFRWLDGLGAPAQAVAPLSWEEVAELARRGADFGSHTVSHRPLEPLREGELRQELEESRRELEKRLGRRIVLFSAPFAWPEEEEFGERLSGLLRQARYLAAVTTAVGRVGRWDDLLALPRLPVSAADSLADFEAKLAGAYDWLRPVQRAYKRWLKPRLVPAARLARPTPQ